MPSLNDAMKKWNTPVEMLRNSQAGMYVYPVVTPEFQNWRNEQAAWRESAVLFDQSHHMDEVIVEGPQATEFLSHHGINSFANFDLNRAKHFVPVTPNGHVIGDHIIFREREDKYILVGRAPTSNWLMFAAAWGKWNVRLRHDPRSPSRPEGERVLREHYRYQIQGPEAYKIFEKMNGGPIPDIKFFHVDWINIGSKKVQALRHGMSGAPGLEVWGPYKDKDYIHSVILESAKEAGVNIVQCGSRAYSTNTLESGWIPSPLPGIYTGDGMLADYRDWLGADMYEAAGAIGGSFVSDNIEDYYVNPFELGYDFYIGWKKDDFIGKAALEKIKAQGAHRKKVTFEWNREDVLKVIASGFEEGTPYKWIDFPQPNYASSSADMVMQGDQMVGMSMFNGYSWNERCMLSLGVVHKDVQVGDVLTLRWGEPDDTAKTSTEKHKQAEIRVRVSPTPYAKEARENYADSWRTKAAE
ncbi:vanillate/3-O-methylgallate O-demethylase [Mameliella alba]|uniref:Glycine cleavage system protein T n=1 Tax=Mameliella alba TaxID=561184 RepID=A0A0B3RH74_9RHOB|nr:aminomethyltransferase family protein [Mameliella alba]KHQ50650.1 Glycine cleavage system protein T [Mameliella alba]MBY6122656.1 aminomethyltransferase family protein [Mameliella alba]OWV46057.1 glycine cleavage system protein T [Mameliella alba]OWV55120.1 glycine cleavage system protein T [Mameliella alba]PTR37109.1 vanillate/3-O-methylgallate O-demethylase [Mameliella alba]